MDNATHTIAALLVARAAIALRGSSTPPPPRVARAAAIASVAANNWPDLDFLYAGITPGKLGYLLHHRGHTHTVVVALGGAALVAGVTLALLGRQGALSRRDAVWIVGLSLFGGLLHIGMDFVNNYGVHPFWPWDNRWFYGDAVFILEPWFWVFSVPVLVAGTASWPLRVALGAVLLTGLVLAWTVDFVPWSVALALTLASIASAGCVRVLRERGRLLWGVLGCVGVALVFAGASRVAAARVAAVEGETTSGGVTRRDLVLTPAPANPLCFSAIAVDTVGERYRLRVGRVAVMPAIVSASRCEAQRWGSNLPMIPVRQGARAEVVWETEWSAPLAELAALHRSNCEVRAALCFMRVPYWMRLGEDAWYVGDLRYDRGGEEGFAEMRIPARPAVCPPWVPPWIPPRRDLLD